MKMFAKNRFLRGLAAACICAGSCFSANVHGQQLLPVTGKQAAPPEKSPDLPPLNGTLVPKVTDLAPVVKAEEIEDRTEIPFPQPIVEPPIVNAQIESTWSDELLPPIVPASTFPAVPPPGHVGEHPQVQALPESTLPLLPLAPVVRNQYAAQPSEQAEQNTPHPNLPPEAQREINEFVHANRGELAADLPMPLPVHTAELMVAPEPAVSGEIPLSPLMTPAAMQPAELADSFAMQQDSPSDIPARPATPPNLETPPAPTAETIVDPRPQTDPGLPPVISRQYAVPESVMANDYFVMPQQPGVDPNAGNVDVAVDVQAGFGSPDAMFGCCGFVMDARRYVIADALAWTREGGTFRASNITNLDNFDWSWGGRITVGRRVDCMIGWEATYMMMDPWISASEQRNPPGTLFGAVFPSAQGFSLFNYTAFRNANFMEQFQKSDLHSFELNRTWWGADVAKAFLGARYIYFDDEFHLSSSNIFGERGIHTLDHTNLLFGLHAGGEVIYDIGYRLSFSAAGKLGGYANFIRNEFGYLNVGNVGGTFSLNRVSEDTEFAASLDLGVYARYRIGPRARIRAGYEAMVLVNVNTAEANFTTIIDPTSGVNFNDDSATFHGATIGVEIYR